MHKLSYGIGFFSACCFLSNFFECGLVCRNVPYTTLEQGYQARKADTCKDRQAHHDIMNSKFPAEPNVSEVEF